MSDIDFDIPKEITDEWYSIKLDEIASTHTIPLRINYQIGGVFNKTTQTWTTPKTDKYIDVVCSYREDAKIGDIVSSQIVSGMPTGDYKIFIPIAYKFELSSVTDYVPDSLYFTLRPTSSNPITLYPKTNGVSIEYLLDRSEYELVQRWLCSVIKGV